MPPFTTFADFLKLPRRLKRGLERIPVRDWGAFLALCTRRHFRRTARAEIEPERVTRVIFVCQGNIMRSAFASAVWSNANPRPSASRPRPHSVSAGCDARSGNPAHPAAMAAAAKLGVSLAAHRACRIDELSIHSSDLLIAFDLENLATLRRISSSVTDSQLVLLADLYPSRSLEAEIRDPWGQGEATTMSTFQRISDLLIELDRRLSLAHTVHD